MRYVDYDLAGKVALVTGVSRRAGIGAAIALALARAGANIFTTYYSAYEHQESDPAEAQEIVSLLREQGVSTVGVEADLADPDAPSALFDQAETTLGPVDILINNATRDICSDIYGMDSASLDAHYAVNVRGASLLCAEFARRHDGRPGGRIINLTSGQGLEPMPGELPYAVTKGAVEALTLSLSASLKDKQVTVNAVDPGATDTGWIDAELRAALAQRTLARRIGTPEDAANLILFLASAKGGWITGQVIRSRGGA